MKVEYRPRRHGKTIEAIKKAAETGSYIVCLNQKESHRIAETARSMGIDINFPITFDEFLKGQYCGRNIKGFVIDNADMFLQHLTSAPINLITLTQDRPESIK